VTDLPAAVAAEAAVTVTAVKSAAEYVSVHSSAAGGFAGAFNDRFRVAVAPVTTVAEDSVSVDCPNAQLTPTNVTIATRHRKRQPLKSARLFNKFRIKKGIFGIVCFQ
jgi:hypothetical protein